MRKQYQKPALLSESFEVCEHIAKNCGLASGWSTHWEGGGDSPCGIYQFDKGGTDILFYSASPCNVDLTGIPTDEPVIDYHGETRTIEALFSS